MSLHFFQNYINNFKGFSKEIWILALITFINRAGTMVLPFLSKYLNDELHFTYNEIGTMFLFYGVGSMIGSWLGGRLTDIIGFYKIMTFSLFFSGLIFISLQCFTSFYSLCFGMFLIMLISDMFRPAMFVSIGAYAADEIRTRAFTLIRMAINLGFAAGPALAGMLIISLGYNSIFWVDGITCLLAVFIFIWFIKQKRKSKFLNKDHPGEVLRTSVFKDKIFNIFLVQCIIIGVMFFQLFTTIPIYHKKQFNLSEFHTGMLLTLNGILVFFSEMSLVTFLDKNNYTPVKNIIIGCVLMTISIFLLLIDFWVGTLVIMMVFMSYAEMFAFPYSNAFTMSRAKKGQEGRYMAIFTMTFSVAHIISSKLGMYLVSQFGFSINFLIMGLLGVVSIVLGIWIKMLLKKEFVKTR